MKQDIYNIHLVKQGRVEKTYCFKGKENIENPDPDIKYVDFQIYGDDTIQRVKEKIVKLNDFDEYSIKELYLFCVTRKNMTSEVIYKKITNNDEVSFKKDILSSFLSNIVNNSNSIDSVLDKYNLDNEQDIYTINDLDVMDVWNKDIYFQEPIGQSLIYKNYYPFIANPHNNTIKDDILYSQGQHIISTQNKKLLFKSNMIDNNIYICLADDVLDNKQQDIEDEYYIKLYFPHLYIQNIKNIDDLISKRQQFIEDEKKNKLIIDNYNNVIDFFHELNNNHIEYLDIENNEYCGVKNMIFDVFPENKIELPLELLFKNLHADNDIPFLKFNPGKNLENIYRLFTDDNVSIDNEKIPVIYIKDNYKKKTIKYLMNVLSNGTSIGFYILYDKNIVLVDIMENGVIKIKFLLNKTHKENYINELLEVVDNFIVKKIRTFIEKTGQVYINLKSIRQSNIQINKIKYEYNIEWKNKINVSKYINCFSTIFSVYKSKLENLKDIVKMKYKRVSMFKEMDEKKEFITKLKMEGYTLEYIILELLEKYSSEKLKEVDVMRIIGEWESQIAIMSDSFGNKGYKIENTQGFDVEIKRNTLDNINLKDGIIITVDDIDDLKYIHYINVYISSILIILNKNIESTVKTNLLNKLCVKNKTLDAINVIDEEEINQDLNIKKNARILSSDNEMSDEDESDDGVNAFDFLSSDDEDDYESESDDDDLKKEEASVEEEEPVVEQKKEEEEENVQEEGGIDMDQITFDDDDDNEFDMFSDEEEEEEEEEAEEENIIGGVKSEDAFDIDLSDKSISGSKSIFTEKLRKANPKLFKKYKNSKYKGYSNACPFQFRKQPIILTDEEKDFIDQQDKISNTKSYDEHITHESIPENETESKKFHYICPRFWCLRDDDGKSRSLSFKQINQGECGGWDALIPYKSKKIPKGKRIVEFTDDRMHRSKQFEHLSKEHKLIYKPMYPGYQDTNKQPNNMCIPCCFQSPTKEGDNVNRHYYRLNKDKGDVLPEFETDDKGNVLLDENDEIVFKNNQKGVKQNREKIAKKNKRLVEYNKCDVNRSEVKSSQKVTTTIPLGSNKFPLVKNQFGHIPINVQKLLFLEKKNRYLKNVKEITATKMLLRIGVEHGKNKNQSFLGVIGDVYFNIAKNQEKYDSSISVIENIKKIIIKQLNIDKFIFAQNGNLIQIFYNDKTPIVEGNEIINNSVVFKQDSKILTNKQVQYIINSYTNFKQYLNNPSIHIDYNYLWDLISQPIAKNGVLFEDGINLIIMNDVNDDITSKIEIICPTNYFSNVVFDKTKQSVLIYQKNNKFEPIYEINRNNASKQKKFNIKRFFSWDYLNNRKNNKLTGISDIFEEIIKIYIEECNAKKSMENYDFISNLHYTNIIQKLSNSEFKPIFLVSNTLLNIIGMVITYKENTYFLPCALSSIHNNDIEVININDERVPINKLSDVVQFLTDIEKMAIPSQPTHILLNDQMVVGVLTITNQVILTIPEVYNKEYVELNVIDVSLPKDKNYYQLEESILNNDAVDTERDKIINFIKLEDKYYNNFRNLFKLLINKNENRTIKTKIKNIIENITLDYFDKFDMLKEIIITFLSEFLMFSDFSDEIINDTKSIEEMTSCFNLNESNCEKSIFCNYITTTESENGICKVILPKKNLINQDDNEILYYMRMVDEMVRHNKIRNFLLSSRSFLSLDDSKYNIKDNEILLLEEDLLNKYKNDIVLQKKDDIIGDKNVYDTINPDKNNININYSNVFNLPMSDNVNMSMSDTSDDDDDESLDDIFDMNYRGDDTRDEDTMNEKDLKKKNIDSTMTIVNDLNKKKIKTSSDKKIRSLLYTFNNTSYGNIKIHKDKLYKIKNNAIQILDDKDLMKYVNATKETLVDILNENSDDVTLENFNNILKNIYKDILSTTNLGQLLFEIFYVEKKLLNKLYKKTNRDTVSLNSMDDINNYIDREDYMITEIDILILIYYYKLPIIIASGNMTTFFKTQDSLIIDYTKDSTFAYILVSNKIVFSKMEMGGPGLVSWYALENSNKLKINKETIYLKVNKEIVKDIKLIEDNIKLYNNTKINFDSNKLDIYNRKNMITYKNTITKTIKGNKQIKLGHLADMNKVDIYDKEQLMNYLKLIKIKLINHKKIIKYSKIK